MKASAGERVRRREKKNEKRREREERRTLFLHMVVLE